MSQGQSGPNPTTRGRAVEAGHRPASVVVVRPKAREAVIECSGEHDLLTQSRLDDLLEAEIAGNDLVVVDVTEADFIDSSFLHSLVKANELARRRGSRFVLQLRKAST